MRSRALAFLVVLAVAAVPAAATLPGAPELLREDIFVNPVATDEVTYQAYARVWPDPHGCFVHGDVVPPEAVSPWAKGRVCAADYLSYMEVVEGAKFLERRFPEFVEVIRLDTAYGEPDYLSAGLPRALVTENGDLKALGRDRSPLYMFKVTDAESEIPEEDRHHFVFGLSIHGLERAGLEGGVRAMEDLVTWAACERGDERAENTPACDLEGPFADGKPIVESETERPVPTASETLQNTVSYFMLSNPDGWRAGQRQPAELRDGNPNVNYLPGPSFARGNGNGVDLNRDWPNTGYIQKSHQTWSEPETRSFGEVLLDIKDRTSGGHFAGGIDLHGMLTATAFSYTLLGADQRDFRKNEITVETSLRTYEDQTARLTWSPYIGDSTGDGQQDRQAPIPVADEWGTIYDTIGYTVTGALGFFIDDSRLGLGGVGINNEMALSNLAPNSVYEPALNQTHIDGNKGLIYSQIAALLYEQPVEFEPGGKVAYVENPLRITKEPFDRPENTGGFPAQPGIDVVLPCQGELQQQLPGNCGPGEFKMDGQNLTYEFDVRGPAERVWNGGMTVTSTRHGQEQGGNVGGVHSNLIVERWGVDHGSDEEGWIVETSLARSAVTINDPLPGRWRVRYGPTTGTAPVRRVTIDFDPVTAHESPGQLPVDASSMDFFTELNEFVPEGSELEAVQVEKVLGGAGTLRDYDTVIVTNSLGDREYLADELGLTSPQIAQYFAGLKAFAEGGGNLVLTDAALLATAELGLVPHDAVNRSTGLAGFYGFNPYGDVMTYEDPETYPLADGVGLPGAAERTPGNRQAVEPTPLGYNPNSASGHPGHQMPFWGVDRDAWEANCDKGSPELCTTATTTRRGSRTSIGEVGLGEGTVRIVGALLPDPNIVEDHIADVRFGLGSYALTYTAYIVFDNLIDYRR